MTAQERKNSDPILAGVIGWPISHSLSPLIHTFWAAQAGVDGYYIPIAAPPAYDEFVRTMESLRTVGFAGVNVTLPHKEHALQYADEATQTAKRVGAANMLTFTENGVLADNSDVTGFSMALHQAAENIDISGTALILGAGGAARAIALAVREAGFSAVEICNRTQQKAQEIADIFNLTPVPWEERSARLSGATLVVNTTSLGMSGQPPLQIDESRLCPGAVVADIVYSPLETPLLAAPRRRGCAVVDGLSMLMHQARPGFATWFGGEGRVNNELRCVLINALERQAKQ
ncbi:MAG: shikimate dehydrogenase [Pseudomonadota bacterium]